jgi:hypothetical protein
MATHPANAVFVSGDGKVSFNENGRKLDSNGNVVWGDRQSLRGARARVRPEIIEAYEREAQAQQQAQQAPPVQEYRPPAVAEPVLAAPPADPWAGVSAWDAPMQQGQNWRQYAPPQRPAAPAWEPPPSGMGGGGAPPNWNQYTPPQQRQQAPPQQAQQQMYLPMVQSWNRFRR